MRSNLVGTLAAGLLAMAMSGMSASMTRAASDISADVCLEIVTGSLPEGAWERIFERVAEVAAVKSALFPEPALTADPVVDDEPSPPPAAPASSRLDIQSGHAVDHPAGSQDACLGPDLEWTARFGRAFLEASAKRMLEEAPTTPGIASEVILEWFPDEGRVRTLLTFAGPLDIPNGRCWVDDVLSIDSTAGIAISSGEQGLETSLFAESACGRFFDHLPDGGAGEQAVTLLPAEFSLDDGTTLRFVASQVSVEEGAISIGGTLEVR